MGVDAVLLLLVRVGIASVLHRLLDREMESCSAINVFLIVKRMRGAMRGGTCGGAGEVDEGSVASFLSR